MPGAAATICRLRAGSPASCSASRAARQMPACASSFFQAGQAAGEVVFTRSSRAVTIQPIALAAVRRAAGLGEPAPARAGRGLLAWAALDDQVTAFGCRRRMRRLQRLGADAGVVAERGALRRRQRALRKADRGPREGGP